MYGIFVIFLFYALGIFLSRLTGEFLPGSVLGMILLFLALLSGVVKNDRVKPVASLITRNMALFFVPVGVGVIESGSSLVNSLPAVIVAAVVSTILVMIVTGHIQQFMEGRRK